LLARRVVLGVSNIVLNTAMVNIKLTRDTLDSRFLVLPHLLNDPMNSHAFFLFLLVLGILIEYLGSSDQLPCLFCLNPSVSFDSIVFSAGCCPVLTGSTRASLRSPFDTLYHFQPSIAWARTWRFNGYVGFNNRSLVLATLRLTIAGSRVIVRFHGGQNSKIVNNVLFVVYLFL
jgi:hypothetical protein